MLSKYINFHNIIKIDKFPKILYIPISHKQLQLNFNTVGKEQFKNITVQIKFNLFEALLDTLIK